MNNLTLLDDGTLDTVFECSKCGEDIRFSGESIERDEDGYMTDDGLAYAEESHAEDCGWETTDHL